MSEFTTTADVIFRPDQRSLREVRDAVESIGPVQVEFDQGARNPAARRAGRTDGGTLTAGRGNVQTVLKETRDINEDILVQLEDMADTLGGGAGGGGGATEILAGIVGDVGTEAAGTAAETVGSVGGTAAGSALGTLAGEIIASKTAGGGGGGSVSLEDDTVSVDSDDTPLPVEDVSLTVEKPDWVPLPVENPGTVGVDDPPPLSIEEPEPVPVDAPDSIPIDVPTVSPGAPPSGAPSVRGPPESVYGTAPSTGGSSGPGLSFRAPGVAIGDDGSLDITGPRLGIRGRGGNQFAVDAGNFSAGGDGLRYDPGSVTASSGGRRGQRSSGAQADVTATRNTTIQVDPRGLNELKRDIIDEVERMHDQDIRELEQELDRLRRALSGV